MKLAPTLIWTTLLILAVLGGKFGCRTVTWQERADRMDSIRRNVEARLDKLPEPVRQKLRAGLSFAAQQTAAKKISAIALATLRQRTEAVLADNVIYPKEAAHLLRLLDDLPHWQDKIHAVKYMGQR